MSKFNVGDRVRLVEFTGDDHLYMTLNDTGTVCVTNKNPENPVVCVTWDNPVNTDTWDNRWFVMKSSLELVKELAPRHEPVAWQFKCFDDFEWTTREWNETQYENCLADEKRKLYVEV